MKEHTQVCLQITVFISLSTTFFNTFAFLACYGVTMIFKVKVIITTENVNLIFYAAIIGYVFPMLSFKAIDE